MSETRRSLAVDAALLFTVLVWAVNFSVVKATLAFFPPLAFNALRLSGATLCFLALARRSPGPSLLPEDRKRFLVMGLVGHTLYQLLFIHGIAATTASNSAILLGLTPVFVALLSSRLAADRLGASHWTGIAVSILGVYLVLRDSARVGGSPLGDGLTLLATSCWALHTVMSQRLVARYGPIRTSAYTLSCGTLFFLPLAIPSLVRMSPGSIPAPAWWGTLFSMIFALVIAYALWYFAVSRIGPTQTAIYSNLTPVAALFMAYLTLGEPVGKLQLVGALVIFFGIYLVRRRPPTRSFPTADRPGGTLPSPAHT